MGGFLLGCQRRQEFSRCPEFQLEMCIQALARSQAAYQAGWVSSATSWSEVRKAVLSGCGCDSATFNKVFQFYFSNHPEKLERIYDKALSDLGMPNMPHNP
ncbi:MAG: DUF4296 domain-containing protein [Flavobacteriales bacterium]|nr:DUF4296 domain-containing protein [Flavobacteriales bacterium]MDW8409796.1 hypothetical protein [Flavobacteriales bacterium]